MNTISHKFLNILCEIDYKKPKNLFIISAIIIGLVYSLALLLGYWSIIADLLLLFIILIVKSEKNDKELLYLANLFAKKYNKANKRYNLLSKYKNLKFVKTKLWFLIRYINFLYNLVLLSKTTEQSFDVVLGNVHHLYFDILTKDEVAKVKKEKLSHTEQQEIYNKIFHAHKVHKTHKAALSVSVMSLLIIFNIIIGVALSLFFPALISKAATFNWVQTDWSTGVTANNASHATDQTGWLEYSAKDNGVATAGIIELNGLPLGNSNIAFTTAANYSQENNVTGTQISGGQATLKSLGTPPTFPTGGTDHAGANWTPADGSTISGTHYNVGIFTIATGTTVYIAAGVEFAVSATTVDISGTLDASGKGNPNGSGNGSVGSAENGASGCGSGGGSGAGYGGNGGNGSGRCGGSQGGVAYGGGNTSSIYLGSKGGRGGTVFHVTPAAGGAGGGAIHIKTSGDVIVSGSILATGNNGANGGVRPPRGDHPGGGGGGGGSGGGIVLEGNNVTISGIVSANGGNGGDGHCGYSGSQCKYAPGGGGGGGAGGRIKIYYSSGTSLTGQLTVAGGTGGQPGFTVWNFSTPGAPGAVGTTYSTAKGYTTATASYITSAAGSQIDVSSWATIEGVTITQTTPTNTSIKYLVSFDGRTTWKYWNGTAWAVSSLANLQTDGMDNTALQALSATDWAASGGFVFATTTQLDFAADLLTLDGTITPTLDNIDVSYKIYSSSQTLTSSPYDTTSAENTVASISWTENLPTNTDIKYQLRTAPDSAGSPGTWTAWLGPTGTGDYYTDPTGNQTINSTQTDALADQWVQYKVWLTSDGYRTPTLSDVTFAYVVNSAPTVQNVTATQNSDGTVSITYEVKDIDTTTGSVNAGFITPSFQYWNGSTWVTTTTMAIGDTNNKAVTEGSFASYSATWTPTTDYSGQYMNNTAKIRVIANDNEGANNSGSSDSLTYTLDTKIPAVGVNPIIIDASVSPTALTLSATDDTSLQMKISLQSDLAGAAWVAYNSSPTITLATDPDTVYVQFIDALSNATSIYNVTTPETPSAMMVQDTSNTLLNPNELRLFTAWKVVANPLAGFANYKVYKSSDGSNYSLLYTETDRTINYHGDSSTTFDTLYYYQVKTTDTDGNVSYWSTPVTGKANGIQDAGEGGGGTNTTAPTISNVASSNISTTQATISWDTNKLADSLVEYIAVTGGDFSSAPSTGVASMKDTSANIGNHSVVLTGLTTNTTYYYQVKSTDVSANQATNKQGADGYSFTTLSGPVISAIAENVTGNTTATISWTTDIAANSYIYYSTDSSMSGATQVGSADTTTSHSIALTGLTSGTKYYYYIKSGVAEDNNVGVYYDFTTTSDVTGPEISAIASNLITDTKAVISWTTNEGATSQVHYGTATGVYDNSTTATSTYDILHNVTIDSLTQATTYYYTVQSIDASGNSTTSAENTFTTLETLTQESGVVAREQAATDAANTGGGGGVLFVDSKADTTPPVISNIAFVLNNNTATVTWDTNEAADSFVEYGPSTTYGTTYGNYNYNLSHSVDINLANLNSLYYRVASKDKAGNLVISAQQTYDISGITNDLISVVDQNKQIAKLEQQIADLQANNSPDQSAQLLALQQQLAALKADMSKNDTLMEKAKQSFENIMKVVNSLSDSVSISVLESTLNSQYDSIEEIANIIPAPVLSGSPDVTVTPDSVSISWSTDKEADSFVAIAAVDNYDPSREEPYAQVVGDNTINSTDHNVTIYDLKPETEYYYQLRSQAKVGPMAQSSKFSFRTPSELLKIENYFVDVISNEQAKFKWVTNIETDSKIKYTPYRDGVLAADQSRIKTDDAYTVLHEMTIDDFEGGVVYDIELSGEAVNGTQATRSVPTFVTSDDDYAPSIYQVQTSSAISPGTAGSIQTIISWHTNEASTSQVFYKQGMAKSQADLLESTRQDTNYTKKHVVVITKFEPGSVYSFQVESVDSTGNVARSKMFTILAPRQQATVFDVIKNNFVDVFGWTSKLKK